MSKSISNKPLLQVVADKSLQDKLVGVDFIDSKGLSHRKILPFPTFQFILCHIATETWYQLAELN